MKHTGMASETLHSKLFKCLELENATVIMVTCGFSEPDSSTNEYGFEDNLEALKPRIRQWLLKPDNEVLAQYTSDRYQFLVTRKSIAQLVAQTFIGPDIVALIYEYLQTICIARGSGSSIAMMYQLDRQQIKRATFTFLPIYSDKHWTLLVITRRNKQCLLYDCDSPEHRQLAEKIVEELAQDIDLRLNLVEIKTPKPHHHGDCGVLVCEISALLVRRILKTMEGNHSRLCMGLGGMKFSVEAGRCHMLTLLASNPI